MECLNWGVKMYILKLNVLVESSENLDLESEIEMKLEDILVNRQATFVSTHSEELIGANHGKCAECGCWVSDHRKQDFIDVFSNGAKIRNKWYCDICLPEDHPNAF